MLAGNHGAVGCIVMLRNWHQYSAYLDYIYALTFNDGEVVSFFFLNEIPPYNL